MVKITFLGHAGFQIKDNGKTLLVDVWTGSPTYPAKYKIDSADYLLVSHGHADHLSSAPDIAKQTGAKVVCIFDITHWLVKQGVEADKLIGMNKGGTIDIGDGFKVSLVHAVHSSTIGEELLAGGEAAGFIIHTPDGHKIYHAGDTSAFGDMKLICDIYSPDIGLIPIGDHFTMGPLEASYALDNLLPSIKTMVPMHFGTFPLLTGTPEKLKELTKRDDLVIKVLEPGASLEI
jgi:L-ascorbate metabolism protein UlaG (beta-lactamase superfamily)